MSNGNKPSIALVNDPNDIHSGDVVTITYDAPKVDFPTTAVKVFQNGTLVYAAGGYPPQTSFTLTNTQLWDGGPGQGVAELGSFDPHTGKHKELASVQFSVQGPR